MNVKDVEAKLEELRNTAADPEGLHKMEDQIRGDVLQAISDGSCSDPMACAAAAMKTAELEFERWYS